MIKILRNIFLIFLVSHFSILNAQADSSSIVIGYTGKILKEGSVDRTISHFKDINYLFKLDQ